MSLSDRDDKAAASGVPAPIAREEVTCKARVLAELSGIVTRQAVSRKKHAAAITTRRNPTPAEERLWQSLRRGKLNGLHFRRGQNIDYYVVDFYCHTARLVVEVDGSSHDERREYDAARDAFLARRGLYIMRVTNDEVLHTLRAVLSRIAAVAAERLSTDHAQSPANVSQEKKRRV